MPTLIERIQSQATGNASLSGVAGLVTQVQHAVELFEKLPDAPGEAVSGLLAGLGNVPVPQLQVAARVGGQIAQVAQHMPTDFSSMTSAFDPILSGLEGALGGDVIPRLRQLVRVISAIDGLTRFNLNDAAAAPGGSGTAGGGSGTGGSGGAGAGSGSGAGSGAGAPGAGAGAPGAGPGSGGSSGAGGGSPGAGPGAGSGGATPPSPEVVAARERRLAALSNARSGLAVFPSPLSAPNLVIFLEDVMSNSPRENALVRKLPFWDDAQQLLQTVVRLRGMDETALRAHVGESLQALAAFLDHTFSGYLAAYGSGLQAWAADAGITAIQADMTALNGNLGAVAAAVEAGTLAGKAAELAAAGAALDGLEARLLAMRGDVLRTRGRDLETRTRQLSLDLERQMRQLNGMLQPANTFRLLASLQAPLQNALAQFPPERIAADIKSVLELPLKIFDAIEATGVQEILATPTHAIETMLAQMDAVTGQVAAQVSGVFSEVDRVLAEADPHAMVESVHQAFETLRLAIQAKAQELFAPVSKAIEDALTGLSNAVNGFNPAEIIDGLKHFMEDLAGIFDDPAIKSALDALEAGIKAATQAIQSLSFSPVTDTVADEIKGITAALRAIDPSLLSTEVKLALTAAAALLPSSIDPVADPLVAEFGKLVDEGPKPLLAFLAEKASLVKQELEKLSPSNLIGDALSAPFKSLTDRLDAFQPLSLLDPVKSALDGLKQDLIHRLDPAAALRPLQSAYDGLLAQVERVNPVQLAQPVQDALKQAAHKFREALPLDELIGALTSVIDKINAGLGVADEFRQTLQAIADFFNALADAEQQLRTWLQALLNRIGSWSDVSDLAPAMTAIGAGVDAAKAAGLASAVAAARDPVKAALDTLAPDAALEALIALRRRMRPDRVALLAAGPEKAALETLLARFEPLSALYSEPFRALQSMRQAMTDSEAELTRTLTHWDARHHRAGGPLARMVFPAFSAADLKEIFRQSLEDEFIVPVGGLFATVNLAGQAARAPLTEVIHFLDTFKTRATALLTGDSALGGLRDGLLGLANRIENVDLGFLTRELGGIFDAVKGKVDVINPTHLAEELSATVASTLGLISVDNLLTDEAKKKINDAYHGIVELIKGLDPKQVVQDAVDPVWNEKVKPQALRFDITSLLTALMEKLDALKGELGTDLDTVNTAYQDMLAAIPKADLGELAGAVAGEIGGALGF